MRRAGKARAGHNPIIPRELFLHKDSHDTANPCRWIDTQLDSASIDADIQTLRSRGVDIALKESSVIGDHPVSQ